MCSSADISLPKNLGGYKKFRARGPLTKPQRFSHTYGFIVDVMVHQIRLSTPLPKPICNWEQVCLKYTIRELS